MNNDFQTELMERTRLAMESRIKAEQPQPKVQYNIVLPVTKEQAERIIKVLEGK